MKRFQKPAYALLDLKDATITIGGVTAEIGNGTVSYDEKQTVEYIKSRGKLDEVRLGDEEPVDVKLDFQWKYVTSTAAGDSIESAIKGTGTGTTSSDSDPCNPYACDIVIAFSPACGSPLTITLSDFRWETMSHDLKAAMVSVSGKCNVTQATVSYSS